MYIVENKKYEVGTVYTTPTDIIGLISQAIASVSMIDEKTLGITFKKDIITYNDGNSMHINKGLSIRVGEQIHDNPNIDVLDVMKKPDKLNEVIKIANEKAREQYLEQLKSLGIELDQNGHFDLNEYNKCRH